MCHLFKRLGKFGKPGVRPHLNDTHKKTASVGKEIDEAELKAGLFTDQCRVALNWPNSFTRGCYQTSDNYLFEANGDTKGC